MENKIYKSYLIINSDLNLSIGKTLAQVAHGGIYLERFLSKSFGKYYSLRDNWIASNEIIITLKAKTNVINKLKSEYTDYLSIVDIGLNEVSINTETGIVLMPLLEENKTKTLQRCQTFKLDI